MRKMLFPIKELFFILILLSTFKVYAVPSTNPRIKIDRTALEKDFKEADVSILQGDRQQILDKVVTDAYYESCFSDSNFRISCSRFLGFTHVRDESTSWFERDNKVKEDLFPRDIPKDATSNGTSYNITNQDSGKAVYLMHSVIYINRNNIPNYASTYLLKDVVERRLSNIGKAYIPENKIIYGCRDRKKGDDPACLSVYRASQNSLDNSILFWAQSPTENNKRYYGEARNYLPIRFFDLTDQDDNYIVTMGILTQFFERDEIYPVVRIWDNETHKLFFTNK